MVFSYQFYFKPYSVPNLIQDIKWENIKVFLLTVIILLFLTSCSFNVYNIKNTTRDIKGLKVRVLNVIDGDTIKVETQNDALLKFENGDAIYPFETNSIRFLFIDSMESSENSRLNRIIIKLKKNGMYFRKEKIIEMGKMATGHLKENLHDDDFAFVEFPLPVIKDKYGRFLGIVFINGTNLNYLQVRDGYAPVYFLNEGNAETVRYYKKKFIEAEDFAKEKKLGIWKEFSD